MFLLKKGFGQTNKQQRHFNKQPISELGGEIDSFLNQCWNFKQAMGARNRVGIGLSYRPARHRLAKLISWNRFMGSLKV
jgi:hypothetical protein